MAAAPWCRRHTLAAAPDFLGAASVPLPRGPSLILRAADGGFARSHRHLLTLPKAPRFARVRSRPRLPAERSHAGTRFAQTNRDASGSRKRTLSSLQPRRDARVAHGDSRERGVAGSLPNATWAEGWHPKRACRPNNRRSTRISFEQEVAT